MSHIAADNIEPGDIVTMKDTFQVTDVDDQHVWAGPVAYTKRSLFSGITRTWDLSPAQPR